MPSGHRAKRVAVGLLFVLGALARGAQPAAPHLLVDFAVVDENGVAVQGAQVTILEDGRPPVQLWTDYRGHCHYLLEENAPYRLRVEGPGFYRAEQNAVAPGLASVRIVLAHQQMVNEQVNVTASTPGIDTEQTSDQIAMNTAEIINIPYQTSRDIRYLLPFYPGVIQDATEQIHIAGSETWETLDTIDGFDVRSPATGTLDMRVSADAVRSIDEESTRYPVEFGRATGGVIAMYTGMGDNKLRFNATNFIPSWKDLNGIRFDQFVPRVTFSGPLEKGHAWWFDGMDFEYDNIYIPELPSDADTGTLVRGSNLAKAQWNATPSDIVTAGLLFNDYHSPQAGLSALVPVESTTNQDIIAWLPYLRNQRSFHDGALLDIGVGEMRYRAGYEPHGDTPYEITPEMAVGSYFENLTGRTQRLEGTAALYLPPRNWAGRHDFKTGIDLDRITYNQDQTRQPVSYLRQDGSLDRLTTFAPAAPFTLHNADAGAYFEDRWHARDGLLVEPGVRFDWDEIVRRSLFCPRIAVVWAPPAQSTTKLSAGIGIYYEHTYLEDLAQAFAGARYDTYYAPDGITPLGPAEETEFTVHDGLLREPRAANWSVGIERKLPWRLYGGANYLNKRTSHVFTFANQSGPSALAGNYLLANTRTDQYRSEEFDMRRLFDNGYTVFFSYTHSTARTDAALDYLPTPSPLGPQQSGPLAWDVPNRVISWGWLPFEAPRIVWFRKNWDFVYTVDWRTGFPYTAVNAADQVVGAADAYRFPHYVNFSPGLEWRFHFRGQYWGLRGVLENASDAMNPLIVNNNVDSPEFGTFSEPQGRAVTARLRLIGSK